MTAVPAHHPAPPDAPETVAGAERGETLGAALAGVAPDQLAELISTFTEATGRLQQTHETLRSEVARLERELGETRGQLKRARELAALGEMAAGIAHEIRNPLGSIKLYARMLVDDLADRAGEQQTAEKIARAVDGLNAVVGDVLAFSRDMSLELAEIDLVDLCEHAVACCKDRVETCRVRIDLGGVAGSCVADASLMHQALVNVVRNACDALGELPEGESRVVRLITRESSVLDESGQRVAMRSIVVADSGPGIPSEVRARMFNPFFTTRASGTGLGLAIVHRILDAHGGRIAIDTDSEAGGLGGARVELFIPTQDQDQTARDRGQAGEAA